MWNPSPYSYPCVILITPYCFPLTYITFVGHTHLKKKVMWVFPLRPFPLTIPLPPLFCYLSHTFILGIFLWVLTTPNLTSFFVVLFWLQVFPFVGWFAIPAAHPFFDHHTMALCPKVPFVKGPLATLQLCSSLCSCRPLLSKGLLHHHCSKSLLSKDLQVLALGQLPFAKGPATSLFCQERCSAHKITMSYTNNLSAPLLLLWSDDSFPASS